MPKHRHSKTSTTDVWEFLGFTPKQSADLRLRVLIFDKIRDEILTNEFAPRDIEKILDEPQPRISDLLNGKLEKFSSDKLFRYLQILAPKKTFCLQERARKPVKRKVG
jgi:predicted XRE-type DNA-binding protein